MIEKINELNHKLLNFYGDKTQEMCVEYCRPVYADYAGDLRAIGSCVLVELSDRRYFVTASHVINYHPNRCITTVVDGRHFEISGNLLCTSTQNHDADRHDFLWTDVTAQMADIASAYFYADRLFSEVEVSPGHCFSAVGYPISKNKVHHASRTVKAQMIAFNDLGKLDDDFIHVNFRKENCVSGNGATVNAPNLEGMSGGAVFSLGNLDDPEFRTGKAIPRLAGIITEKSKSKKNICATRITKIAGAIIHMRDYYL